jgi:hypothetical protein
MQRILETQMQLSRILVAFSIAIIPQSYLYLTNQQQHSFTGSVGAAVRRLASGVKPAPLTPK